MDRPGPSGVGKEMYRHQKVDRQEGIRSGRHMFMCDVCNKAFRYKNGLKLHVSVHSEERPYVCDVLDKSFRLLVFLKEHQRVHSGEGPYSCDVWQIVQKEGFCEGASTHTYWRATIQLWYM